MESRQPWLRLREGQAMYLHGLEPGHRTVPQWCTDYGVLVALFHVGHMAGGRFLLCQYNTAYCFIPTWSKWCACQDDTEYGRQLRLTTSVNACCSLARLDAQQRLWVPVGLIVPEPAVHQLVAAIQAHRVVQVRKTKGRHVIEPLPGHYPYAEISSDPVQLLYDFAKAQVEYANKVMLGIARPKPNSLPGTKSQPELW